MSVALREQPESDHAALRLDRDRLLDRLAHLRSVLPVFAQELSAA